MARQITRVGRCEALRRGDTVATLESGNDPLEREVPNG
jgi:hypothetical protein